jgi:DNA-binding SARP family transcriptional activator
MLTFRFLGDQQVTRDERPLRSALGRRGIELLALLAASKGKPQPRQRVAGLLWPDSSDTQALTNLRRELHALRSAVGPRAALVTADAGTLQWPGSPDVDCDVATYLTLAEQADRGSAAGDRTAYREAARSAVDCYHGELLPGNDRPWLLQERQALHRTCVHLVDGLIRSYGDGDVGSALELADRRIQLEPFEETGYHTLMRLQILAEDRAAALRTYHRCASMLDRELGVVPGPTIADLYRQLVARPQDGQQPASPGGPSQRRRPGLVGRRSEMQQLLTRWQQAGREGAGLGLVTGEAGIGKSRLLEEFATTVQGPAVRVLRGRCFAGRGQPALAPVAQWLGSTDLQPRLRQIDPTSRAEVERLLSQPGSLPTAGNRAMADAWKRRQFFEGLNHALIDRTTPTALLLDDVQWCDTHTASWLPLFLSAARGAPILVLAAGRTEELAENREITDMLRQLRQGGCLWEIALAPLDRAETASLAAQMVGKRLSDDEVEHWSETTGGFPLFVVEYSRAAEFQSNDLRQVEQPERVHTILQRRLDQLSPSARDVASMASCVGRDASLEMLCEASDLSPELVVDAVDELWRLRIFKGVGANTYDFSHDLLRDAAYASLDDVRKRLFHRRIAQAVELVHGGDLDRNATLLADQYGKAGEPRRAIRYHLVAADQAAALFANSDSVQHYTKGLELLRGLPAGRDRDRLELDLRHGMSAPLNAQHGYASHRLRRELERSAELAERIADDNRLLLSLAGLFAVRFVQGDIAESFRIAERSLALADRSPDDAGQAHFSWAGAATSMGEHAAALPHFEAAHALSIDRPPSIVGTRPEVHGRAWSAHVLWLLGRDEEAVRWSDWAINRAESAGHPYSLAVALAYATITHQLRRDRALVGDMAERTRQICARYDFAYYREWGVILQGWSLGGHAGVDLINQGLASLRAQGALARQPYFLALLAETHLDIGNPEQASAAVDAGLSAAADHADSWWVPELLRLKSRIGPDDQKAAVINECIKLAESQGASALVARAAATGGGG